MTESWNRGKVGKLTFYRIYGQWVLIKQTFLYAVVYRTFLYNQTNLKVVYAKLQFVYTTNLKVPKKAPWLCKYSLPSYLERFFRSSSTSSICLCLSANYPETQSSSIQPVKDQGITLSKFHHNRCYDCRVGATCWQIFSLRRRWNRSRQYSALTAGLCSQKHQCWSPSSYNSVLPHIRNYCDTYIGIYVLHTTPLGGF